MVDDEYCNELQVGQYATKAECESVIPALVRKNEADNLKNGWITTGPNSWTSIDGAFFTRTSSETGRELTVRLDTTEGLRMPTRFRRIGANRFALTIKLPAINAWSRSVVDAETERLRHGVIPIIGADAHRRPYLVGSAVVLVYRGRKVLVTAEHVLSDNNDVELAFLVRMAAAVPSAGELVTSKVYDLAVKLLGQDEMTPWSIRISRWSIATAASQSHSTRRKVL